MSQKNASNDKEAGSGETHCSPSQHCFSCNEYEKPLPETEVNPKLCAFDIVMYFTSQSILYMSKCTSHDISCSRITNIHSGIKCIYLGFKISIIYNDAILVDFINAKYSCGLRCAMSSFISRINVYFLSMSSYSLAPFTLSRQGRP